MFVGSSIPLRHIEQDYFRKPFKIANPQLTVPCAKTLAKDIDQLFPADRTKLKETLANVSHACATADLWTSYSRAYLGMTIHWLDPTTLEQCNDVLSCKRIKGKKSFDVLASAMKEGLDSVGARGKVATTVVDGGTNIRKALKVFGYENDPELSCVIEEATENCTNC